MAKVMNKVALVRSLDRHAARLDDLVQRLGRVLVRARDPDDVDTRLLAKPQHLLDVDRVVASPDDQHRSSVFIR